MDTKKLNLQGVATGSMDVENGMTAENKKKAAITGLAAGGVAVAGTVAAGVAFGGEAVDAVTDAFNSITGHGTTADEDMTAIADDAALDAIASLNDNVADDAAPVVEPETVVVDEPVEVAPAAPTSTHHQPTHTTTTPTTAPEVNPDDVSDEILAADIIDPTDAESADFPYEVGEIAQVYNVNGELETVATITDENGVEMMLVDVNGDQMFDVARNDAGDEVELGVVSSVDDIQLIHSQQQGDGVGYLAANDDPSLSDDNSFEADIVDPTTLG